MKKTIVILLALFAFSLNAQVIKPNHEKVRIPDLKNKTLYFVSPGGSNNKDFIDVINKYWTITKFKIITDDEITKNYNTKNVFFTESTTTSSGNNGAGSIASSDGYKMWSPTEKAIASGKEIKNLDVRFAEPYFEIKIEGNYWYAGFFKNFLQQMQDYMKTYLEKGKAEDVADPSKIAELKNATLYVPNYVMNKAFDDKTPEKLFSKYPNKYEMISSEDLNKKILAGENIYYLITCIYHQNCKIINVVNAKTGQIAYSSFEVKPIYPYLRKNDLGAIAKEIEKAGK